MNTSRPLPSEDLCRLLAEFLARSDAGEPVDRRALIERHPQHAQALIEFFETSDRLEALGGEHDATLVHSPGGDATAELVASPLVNPADEALTRPGEENFGQTSTLNMPAPGAPPAGSPGATVQLPSDATVDMPPPSSKPRRDATRSFRLSRDAALTRRAQPVVRRVFGDYEILQEIAQGGMGVVYKARQRRLNRVVALKMILSGQFANQVEVERFYVEAEAAANLRHPNIVAVHEVGEVEGRHFFSMDFVEGQSLLDMVRRQPLEPRHAAQVVKKIAQTVQFAHDQGVIHRDLKPSNVLVDSRGEPMITDFGLAKRTDGGGSQLTMTGTIIGSPSYMPPEQARGDADVGPLADVYSTGAILYELLTASPPFSAANPFETVKQVLEIEPAPPRVRNPSIPRDLETICLKCLQKEPSRRYASATALAEELGRFLEGRPILARPVGTAEKLVRWCKRNPVVSGMLAVLMIGLIVFVTGMTAAFVSRGRALVAREKAIVAQEKALADARQSFNQTRRAIDQLATFVSENTLLNQPGAQEVRKEILIMARDLYREVLAHRGDDPAVRDELARSYFRLGRIMQDIDSPQEALASLQTARAMQEELLAENAAHLSALDGLGDTLSAIGKSYEKLRRHADALTVYSEAAEARRQLTELAPDDEEHHRKLVNAYMNLAIVEKGRGDNAETDEAAIPFYEAAHQQYVNAQNERRKHLDRQPDNARLRLDLAKGYFNLANVAFQMNLKTEAAAHLQEAIEEFDWLVEQAPDDLEHQYLRAIAVGRLGDFYIFMANPDGAHAQYRHAIERLHALADSNPDVHKYAAALAAMHSNQGFLYGDYSQTAEAIDSYTQALDVLRRLTQSSVEPSHRRELGKTLCDLAQQQAAAGHTDEARRNLEESQTILEALVTAHPQSQDFAVQLQRTQESLGQLAN